MIVYILIVAFAIGSTPAPTNNIVELQHTFNSEASCTKAGDLIIEALKYGTYLCVPKGW